MPRLVDWYPAWEEVPRPRVYVYDLPPEFVAWYDVKQIAQPLEALFLERLMSSVHRTADPDHADFFFVPVPSQSYYTLGPEKAVAEFDKLVAYIRETWCVLGQLKKR